MINDMIRPFSNTEYIHSHTYTDILFYKTEYSVNVRYSFHFITSDYEDCIEIYTYFELLTTKIAKL